MKQLKDFLAHKSHVIWDWNGTLLDDVHLCVEIVAKIAAKHGAKKVTRESYLKNFRFPVVEYYQDLGFDMSRVSYEHLSREFVSAYKEHAHLMGVHAGMPELIAELARSGIKSSILSAAQQDDLTEMLVRFNIAPLFTHIFGVSDNLAHGKIDRGRELVEEIGLPPAKLALIGDTDHDAEVGEALGIDVILLDGGHQCPERLAARQLTVWSRSQLSK